MGWGIWVELVDAPPEGLGYSLPGTEIVTPKMLTLHEGGKYQMVSVPFFSSAPYTAHTFLKLVRDQNRVGCPGGPLCDFPDWDNRTISIEMMRWTGVTFESATYSYFFGEWVYSGPDFPIMSEEAYFMKASTDDDFGADVQVTP
jgi:hypothetical protein